MAADTEPFTGKTMFKHTRLRLVCEICDAKVEGPHKHRYNHNYILEVTVQCIDRRDGTSVSHKVSFHKPHNRIGLNLFSEWRHLANTFLLIIAVLLWSRSMYFKI